MPTYQFQITRFAIPVCAAVLQAVLYIVVLVMYRGALCAGFGWDSCEKGNWYETLKGQIPELKV